MSAVNAPASVPTDRAHAESLDLADPLAAYRNEFVFPKRADGSPVVYLCGNSLGLMPVSARLAVEQELERWGALAVEGHFKGESPWYSYHEAFKDMGARLLGARSDEVIMMNSLTVNLHLMMTSFYRPHGDRTRILVEDDMFPSDRYAVTSQMRLHGLDPSSALVVARPRPGQSTVATEDIEEILAEQGQEIALVMLSGLNYFTGQLFDMARITGAAKRAGCMVGFDLAHSAGNVPHALHDWDMDFAVWCNYKYLNSGPGAVGGCFVHARHANDRDLQRLAGWWGNDPSTRFQMHLNQDFVPQSGADGWQVSNPAILALAPMKASLEVFDRAGMDALRTKSIKLTGYLEGLLRSVPTDGFEILTPTDPAARGCQLSLRIRHDPKGLFTRIADRGVVTDFREPDVIRVAPTPLYNTFLDTWTFVHELRHALDVSSPPPPSLSQSAPP